jgi:hypothetical protein
MKHISKLTIKEFNRYKELIEDSNPDWVSIFQLFGEDITDMNIQELTKLQLELESMYIDDLGIFDNYEINGKMYKTLKDITKMTAAQFIDFQTYMVDNELHKILSIFLIPSVEVKQSKLDKLLNRPIKYDYKKYGIDYSIDEVQSDILNHFTIGKAHTLSVFFLMKSNDLLVGLKEYLEITEVKKRMKLQKENKKRTKV